MAKTPIVFWIDPMLLCLPAECPQHPNESSSSDSLPSPTDPPRPILSLKATESTLYSELIQTADGDMTGASEKVTMVWVRPLLLHAPSHHPSVLDLQGIADLVWPIHHFAPAYAEDLLPLWDQGVKLAEAQQLLWSHLQVAWKCHQYIWS